MLLFTKRKFLFKCDECETIINIELDDEDDLKKINNNEIVLECSCGGQCEILKD